MTPALKKYLHDDGWLGAILQRQVYKVIVEHTVITGLQEHHSQIARELQEIQAQRVFLYTKIPVEQTEALAVLQEHRLRLVDTNVTFERLCSSQPGESHRGGIRFAIPADEPAVVELARKNFIYSRFHLDHAIPPEFANTVKAEWTRSFFKGRRGDQMVVAEANDGSVIGFLQLLYAPDKTIIIDLIAVDQFWHRKGIGRGMMAYAERHCGDFRQIRVGTQIANIPSVRLYEAMGFRLINAQYVCHYWAQSPEERRSL